MAGLGLRRIFVRLESARPWQAVAVAAALSAAIAWLAHGWSERIFLEETRERARAALDVYTQGLDGALRKYEVVPALLARRAEVLDLFRHHGDGRAVARANRLTEEVNRTADAEDVYFMAPDGMTFAASNWAAERPFVGKNFSYRPYFRDAMAGKLGRYFALGTTSNKRGYYFAYPVRDGEEALGAVVVKMNVDRIEQALASGKDEVIVTDANGVVFIASKPDWRFKTLGPLSPEALAEIGRNRQYPVELLSTLELKRPADESGFDLIEVAAAKDGDRPAGTVEYLIEAKHMPTAGWTVHILAGTGWARSQVTTTVAISLLVCLLAILLLAVVAQRRRRLVERIELQASAAAQLERQVRERTADLSESNLRLGAEVAERKATEAALRQTQSELVQAGKLAALGQMSAAISHEFNQPLAAIRSYADNAAQLIDRGRDEEARANCDRIRDLTERVAEIGKHLSAFARKPRSESGPVAFNAVIDDTLAFLRGRIGQAGAAVDLDRPSQDLYVQAGSVRLQQVLTNLLLNALDAMEGAPGAGSKRIEIALREGDGQVRMTVRDHGPGIPADAVGQVFDPFFTTKEVGKGLGLGLSISYNIVKDFGGGLTADNHPGGGAVFTLTLPAYRPEPAREAAE